jgi:hypothetical protein
MSARKPTLKEFLSGEKKIAGEMILFATFAAFLCDLCGQRLLTAKSARAFGSRLQ